MTRCLRYGLLTAAVVFRSMYVSKFVRYSQVFVFRGLTSPGSGDQPQTIASQKVWDEPSAGQCRVDGKF
jgi:hypothetical protein